MPGTIAIATVSPTSTVLPASLCTAYGETLQYPLLLLSSYHDSTIERSLLSDGVNPTRAHRTWNLTKRLTTSQVNALLAFFEARQGGLMPFYFYDPYDVTVGQKIGANYDATGVGTQGRKIVHFAGDWGQTTDVARHNVSQLTLVEVA